MRRELQAKLSEWLLDNKEEGAANTGMFIAGANDALVYTGLQFKLSDRDMVQTTASKKVLDIDHIKTVTGNNLQSKATYIKGFLFIAGELRQNEKETDELKQSVEVVKVA